VSVDEWHYELVTYDKDNREGRTLVSAMHPHFQSYVIADCPNRLQALVVAEALRNERERINSEV
jgi:hypothetical protein